MASDDPYADRRRLTFEQAEGAEPLPSQLRLKEITPALSARLWAIVYEFMVGSSDGSFIVDTWRQILLDYHVNRLHKPADEFADYLSIQCKLIKPAILSRDYIRLLGFIQFALRHKDVDYYFSPRIDQALKISCAAYSVLDGKTIVPIGSEAELKNLKRALDDLASSEFRGARVHLADAGAALASGDWRNSIRESIHAVESVARSLGRAGSLSDALTKLEQSTKFHPALKKGFLSIYGFTSDEQGIRHPLIDSEDGKVDESDALFMIGACAAFVSYLIGKAGRRTSG